MKTIIVSGTPGTGKTALSKKLAKRLKYYYLDVNEFISKNKLSDEYDKKRKTKIVNVHKLNKALIKEINTLTKNYINEKYNKKIPIKNKKFKKNIKKYYGIIIDSHLSHYLPRRYADFCIITKCGIKELSKRLERKRFHKEKIRENLEAEIFDVCYNEALGLKHKIIKVDTAKSFNIDSIIHKIK